MVDSFYASKKVSTEPGQLQSIVVNGTVYPSYAGVQAVTASSTQNTTTIPSAVTLAFTNVPVVNNAWVIADVVGYDQANGTGSHIDLGQLAGLVNVSTGSTSATIDGGSTLRLQVAISAMLQGILSSYELQNETSLDGHLGTVIAGTAPVGTGLFTSGQIVTFMSTLYQAYNRTLTVSSGSQAAALATVGPNMSDTGERYFVNNATQTDAVTSGWAAPGSTQAVSGEVALRVVGNPFSGLLQANAHTPVSNPNPAVAALAIRAEAISAPSGRGGASISDTKSAPAM